MSGSLNPAVTETFSKLTSQEEVTNVEYVWIAGGASLRSKSRVIRGQVRSLADIPNWNFDGSSTGQADGHDSEVIIKPVKMIRDPFRGGNGVIVLCDTYKPVGADLVPVNHIPEEGTHGINGNNHRHQALAIFSNPKVNDAHPWYGLEQEYVLFHSDNITPLGWPKGGFPAPQGPYYCSAGSNNAFGRDVAEAHLSACLYAGLQISGINAEVFPGQWEYQVGPCEGIDAADQLWLSRYILHRICEKFDVIVSFAPKPVPGDWNGSGCHTNYSTAEMRDPNLVYEYISGFGPYVGKKLKGGFAKIVEAIERMGAPGKPAEHIEIYGPGFRERLTGAHETSRYDEFSYGVANRGASIRIPRDVEHQGYGYFEDRRPSSLMDPYLVTSKIAETTILNQ